jgi:multidrug efflux pump subunit AcrA (membrane-fusion protein)
VAFLGTLAALCVSAALAAPVDDKAGPRPPQTQSPSPPASNVAAAPPLLVAPATIQAFFVTDLYAKDSGYIAQINADIGDHVKKGDVLAVIDDPELQQQYARAQAAVQQARAALEVTKRRIVGLQADRTLQQVTLKRWEQLFTGKAVTNQQLDEQRAKENVSSANLEVGQADVALAEANLLAANADLQRLQALVAYTKIIAPFDGIITRRLVNPGDLVQAATATRPVAALFTCQEIDVLRVFAEVAETSAAAMRPGAPAEVRLYGSSGRALRATITRIAGALDPATRTMRVEIDLPNPDEALLPGMYAQVSLWPPAAAAETRTGSQ